MRRFLKILEKMVWALVVIAIIIVLVLLAIGIIANYDVAANYVSSFLPYFYVVAIVFVIFKTSIYGVKMYLESTIEKESNRLQIIIKSQREQQVAHEEKVTGELDKLINDIASFPKTATADFVVYLNENLHSTVLSLANQIADEKVQLIKQDLEATYQKKEVALNERALSIDAVLKKHDEIERLKAEIAQKEKEEREIRMANTEDYVTLLFSLAKCSVEDVEKVWQVTKLFIESGHVVADKQFKIAHNKKLRNAELWQFAKNIVKYNQKGNLDVELYLTTIFGGWFTGNKENFAKNYSVLPKDSLVSKDGVEVDLMRLRAMASPSTDKPENKVQDADF
ncbi:MAG: hypothetical protein UFD09_00630 [Prevotella sp.]|nr:hypothetical protein [Prevotella sp.]